MKVIISRKRIGKFCILITNKRRELTFMKAMEINREQFEQMVNGEKAILIDFWAPWCGYCRRLGPAYEKIAEEYNGGGLLTVGKVNIDEEKELAEKEKIEVIPTLVLYKNGTAVDSIVAPESKAMIEAFIEQALKK